MRRARASGRRRPPAPGGPRAEATRSTCRSSWPSARRRRASPRTSWWSDSPRARPVRPRGARPGAAPAPCAHCGGAGVVWGAEAMPRPAECPVCDGAGERVTEPCASCRGRGVTPARATLRVAIPAGMDTGSQIRIRGEGHAGPFGGPRGDLVVITRVHDDPVFTRKGDNLYAEVGVSIVEAVLGARVPVRTLSGEVDLVVPPGTQSGQVLRIRGRGMPRLASEGRGDLYVTIVGRDSARAGRAHAGALPRPRPAAARRRPRHEREGRPAHDGQEQAALHDRGGRRDAQAASADAPHVREEGPHPARAGPRARPGCISAEDVEEIARLDPADAGSRGESGRRGDHPKDEASDARHAGADGAAPGVRAGRRGRRSRTRRAAAPARRSFAPPPASSRPSRCSERKEAIMASEFDSKGLASGAVRPDGSVAVPEVLSILPLRDTVLFPQAVLPLAAGREASVRLIEDAVRGGRLIGVFGQRDPSREDPQEADLHRVGTVATIHKMVKQPDGTVRLVVQGLTRVRIVEVTAAAALPPGARRGGAATAPRRRATSRPRRSSGTRPPSSARWWSSLPSCPTSWPAWCRTSPARAGSPTPSRRRCPRSAPSSGRSCSRRSP